MPKISLKLPPWAFYAAIIVLAAAALILLSGDGSFDKKDLASGLFALFGTFIGALLAFRLEESRDNRKEFEGQKVSLNRALLVLGVHHNEIRNFLQTLSQYKSISERAFNLPALQPSETYDLRQKFDGLDFLLKSSDPNILFELIIEQQRFDQAMQAIKIRNQFYVDEVQPAMEAHQMNNRQVSDGMLRNAFGERIFEGAINGANEVFEHVQGSDQSLPEMFARLRKAAKAMFPNEKFLQFDLKDLKGLPSRAN